MGTDRLFSRFWKIVQLFAPPSLVISAASLFALPVSNSNLSDNLGIVELTNMPLLFVAP